MTADANEQGTVRYMRCASCGNMNPAMASVCARCGKPLHATPPAGVSSPAQRSVVAPGVPQVTCAKCLHSFPLGSKFCGYCGTALPTTATPMATLPAKGQPPASPVRPVVPSPPRPASGSAPPPLPKPVARPLPTPAPRPVAAPPPTPQPSVVPPPRTPLPLPRPTGAPPLPRPPVTPPRNISGPTLEGTVVFPGLRVAARIEARISEKKADGTLGRAVPITQEAFIGRENCDFNYPQDTLISPRHASVSVREGKVVLKDLNSQSGAFVRQRQDTELSPGDIFLLGRELFRFATQNLDESLSRQSADGTAAWGVPRLQKGPLTAKLEHIRLNGEVVAEFRLDKPETTLGRTTGDLIFKDDPYMSGTHARIVAQPGRFLLQDLRSRNGVYRRVRTEVELADGDEFFTGEQLFHVDVKNVEPSAEREPLVR